MKRSKLFGTAVFSLALFAGAAKATEADIYSIQFSEDGKYLITGGAGGFTLSETQKHAGGIKIWNSETGSLIEALGQRSDLDQIFGEQYGRIGSRRWGISNFKDVVLNGSYPDGKILLLPSSLGRIVPDDSVSIPGFIGASLNFDGSKPERIDIPQLIKLKGDCDPKSGLQDYVGPIVPSNNGRYAALVVNTCYTTAARDTQKGGFEFRSDLHVVDLSTLKVTHTIEKIDAGVYALGITEDGKRVAFVGRDRFAVLDLDTGKRHLVESYPDGEFMIPRQFSTLQFTKDGKKLVSLHNIYDIDSGKEQSLQWTTEGSKKPRRISSVSVAPDLSYFALVMPKRSLIMFGEDGLPKSYGKADRVVLMNTRTGKRIELQVSDSMTRGKRCVTDISPDSERVAVGCKGGLLRVYNARSGILIWKKRNIGSTKDHGLIQTRSPVVEKLYSLLETENIY